MNQSTGCSNIFSVSPSVAGNSCSSQSLQCDGNERCSNISRNSSCRSATSVDRSHTAVIVSPPSGHHHQHQNVASQSGGDLSMQFEGASFYSTTSYVNAQQYFANETAAATASSSTVFQAPNFLPPYYGLPQTLTDFNMLHMCCQPFLSEIASPGTESSPTAEAIYGFSNRLQPISSGPHSQQFVMPQSYPQSRNGYMTSTVSRPGSAAGKRGGRRPKECEEFDVTMSEEERDKRDKRRLRNKEAAARCRQRRIDLMGSLQNQVDQLKQDNKVKDNRIAELQLLKTELLNVIRDHQCILPESLRQTLDAELASSYVTTSTSYGVGNDMQFSAPPPISRQPGMITRKRPAGDMVNDFRTAEQITSQASSMPLNTNTVNIVQKAAVQIKQEPTLYSVNNRDHGDDEMKRPTTLFPESLPVTSSNYSNPLASGVPITTPSNINGEYPSGISLLEGPTGLTPMQPPPITAFTGAITPLANDGQSYASL